MTARTSAHLPACATLWRQAYTICLETFERETGSWSPLVLPDYLLGDPLLMQWRPAPAQRLTAGLIKAKLSPEQQTHLDEMYARLKERWTKSRDYLEQTKKKLAWLFPSRQQS